MIRRSTYVAKRDRLKLGPHAFVNEQCYLDASGGISLGAWSRLGPGVHIYTSTHPLDADLRRDTRTRTTHRAVQIGRDVWVGGRAVILPGVTIGDGAVIGAGSVVTKDVPPGEVWAGNPARKLR